MKKRWPATPESLEWQDVASWVDSKGEAGDRTVEDFDGIKWEAGHGGPPRGLELILMDYRAMERITPSDLGL